MANKRTVSILTMQKVSTFDFDPKNAPYETFDLASCRMIHTSAGQLVWSRLPVKGIFVAAIVFFMPISPKLSAPSRFTKIKLD